MAAIDIDTYDDYVEEYTPPINVQNGLDISNIISISIGMADDAASFAVTYKLIFG